MACPFKTSPMTPRRRAPGFIGQTFVIRNHLKLDHWRRQHHSRLHQRCWLNCGCTRMLQRREVDSTSTLPSRVNCRAKNIPPNSLTRTNDHLDQLLPRSQLLDMERVTSSFVYRLVLHVCVPTRQMPTSFVSMLPTLNACL